MLLGSLASLRCHPEFLYDIIQVLTASVARVDPSHRSPGRILSRAIGALAVLMSQLKPMESRDISGDVARTRMNLIASILEQEPKVYEIASNQWRAQSDIGSSDESPTSQVDEMDLFLWLQV